MTIEAWEKVPIDCRPKLLADAKEIGAKINDKVSRMGGESIDAMKKNGLVVTALTDAERTEWRTLGEKTWPVCREQVCKPDDWDVVKAARDEFRAQKKGAPVPVPVGGGAAK